jgi:hypothetical protein
MVRRLSQSSDRSDAPGTAYVCYVSGAARCERFVTVWRDERDGVHGGASWWWWRSS